MDVDALRQAVTEGAKPLRITRHAPVEAFKDGLDLADLRCVFEIGPVVEEYEQESRVLLLGWVREGTLPVHLVAEGAEDEVVIVTAYAPDPSQWIDFRRRR